MNTVIPGPVVYRLCLILGVTLFVTLQDVLNSDDKLYCSQFSYEESIFSGMDLYVYICFERAKNTSNVKI